jgi:hypothetical protein
MKSLITTPTVVVLTVMFFALGSLMLPETAEAKWRDHSDELRGADGLPTGLLVATGVIVVGGLTYWLVKSSKKDDKAIDLDVTDTEVRESEARFEGDAEQDVPEPGSGAIDKKDERAKLSLFLDAGPMETSRELDSSPSALEGLKLHTGLTFEF